MNIYARIVVVVFCAMAMVSVSLAQKKYTYSGEKICTKENTLKVSIVGKLEGAKGLSYQGMDIWKNSMISLQHTGEATVYDFDGKSIKKRGSFRLASYDKTNHSNVASFGNIYYKSNDCLPLLYIARCSGIKLPNGMDKLFYVERIDPKTIRSELIQTIWLNDTKKSFGGYCLGAVDRQNNMFYMYAETTGRKHPESNRHWIMKFRLPEYNGPQDSLVILTEEDALERYDMEDTYTFPMQPITQGATIWNNMLFLPMGVGTERDPSVIYVMDLNTRSIRNVIDLQEAIPEELEDCTIWNGDLYIQTQGHVYKVEF